MEDGGFRAMLRAGIRDEDVPLAMKTYNVAAMTADEVVAFVTGVGVKALRNHWAKGLTPPPKRGATSSTGTSAQAVRT